mgnify:CR=1 FL=1
MYKTSNIKVRTTSTMREKNIDDYMEDLERVTDRLIKAERELIIGTSILVAFLYVSILWVWLAR